MPNAWFRLYSEFADDPKVQMMPEAMQRRLVMLFCSRCKCETLHETEKAFHWRISPEELAQTKELFIEKGFIDEDWNLLNWNRRQFLSDSSTDRVRRHRQGMKQDETLHETGVPVTVTAPDTDTDTEQNRTEQKKPTPKAAPSSFVLPDWIDRDAWAGFEEMRKKIRAPLTDRARRGIANELRALCPLGDNGAAVLDQSTRNSWRGVFELKNGKGNPPMKKPEETWEEIQAREEMEERLRYNQWKSTSSAYKQANPWRGQRFEEASQ